MDIIEIIKIQNRLIEAMEMDDRLKQLLSFNKELLEKMEFERIHPLVFSYETTKLLIKKGFYYDGCSIGKSYRSYEHEKPNCRLCWGEDNTIDFFMKDKLSDGYHWTKIIIQNESMLNEHYLDELLSMAVATP